MILKFLISPLSLLIGIAAIIFAVGVLLFLLKHLERDAKNNLLQNLEFLNSKSSKVGEDFNNISAEYETEVRHRDERKRKKREKRRQ